MNENSTIQPMFFGSSPREILRPDQVDQAEQIMMKASLGSKAEKILNKFWQTPQNTDMAESIFSSEMP